MQPMGGPVCIPLLSYKECAGSEIVSGDIEIECAFAVENQGVPETQKISN